MTVNANAPGINDQVYSLEKQTDTDLEVGLQPQTNMTGGFVANPGAILCISYNLYVSAGLTRETRLSYHIHIIVL